MICIIRIKTQADPDLLWSTVLRNADKLQAVLGDQGRLLYLSKRRGHFETSLFVHVRDADLLGDLIARRLAKLKGVTGLWMFSMLKPRFLPLPPDTRGMKRYAVSVKADPQQVEEVYDRVLNLPLPEEIQLRYLAYTFHLFGDCLQFSVISSLEHAALQRAIEKMLRAIPGVLHQTVCEIEKTYPFISPEEWRDYARRHSLSAEWDEKNMISQFQK